MKVRAWTVIGVGVVYLITLIILLLKYTSFTSGLEEKDSQYSRDKGGVRWREKSNRAEEYKYGDKYDNSIIFTQKQKRHWTTNSKHDDKIKSARYIKDSRKKAKEEIRKKAKEEIRKKAKERWKANGEIRKKAKEEIRKKAKERWKMDEKYDKVRRDMKIEVSVGKWHLQITVDGKGVLHEKMNRSDVTIMRKGGLYLAVLNPSSSILMHSSRHRTFEEMGDNELVRIMMGVQPGRILVLAAMHEGFHQLSDMTLTWLSNLGLLAISDMTTGDRWACIWTQGGKVWAEGATWVSGMARNLSSEQDYRMKFIRQGGPLHLQAYIPRSSIQDSECEEWPQGGVWEERREFCQRYEGYSRLCTCSDPLPLLRKPPSHSLSKVAGVNSRGIPIVVVASQRPLCLYWCLSRLMSVEGSNPELTLVVADGDLAKGLTEVRELTSLFGIKFVSSNAGGNNVTLRITRHYKVVLDTAFTTFSTAPVIIILEEDLYVAKDFYSYFNQLAPLLVQDTSLYCVSAWNDLGRRDSRGDPEVVMRSQTMAGLGWMLTREIYNDIIQQWPARDKHADWDMWLRLPAIQKGRECLVPEVSRTYHFGSTGAHLTANFHALYYAHASFNTRPHTALAHLDKLAPDPYDVYLRGLITNGTHLNGSSTDPCSRTLLPKNSTTTYVLWIKMNDDGDDYTYMGVISCLGLWNLDVRGHHKLVWRLRWKGTALLMVAWPGSPFSSLKPSEASVLIRYDPKESTKDPPVILYHYINQTTTTTITSESLI